MELKRILSLLLMAGVLAFAVGCSDDDDDDNNNPIIPGDESKTAVVNGNSYEDYGTFNLLTEAATVRTGEELDNATDWHIRFQRTEGSINANLDLKAINLADTDLEDPTDFEAITELPDIQEDEWFTPGEVRYVMDGWYNYNTETHQVTGTERVFAFRANDGEYYKFMVTSDEVHGANMGQAIVDVTVTFDVANGGLYAENPQTVTLEDTNADGQIFFSFAQGASIEVSDPVNSTEWDIWFDGFDAKVNSGVSGPGSAGVYPIYQEVGTFEELTAKPMDMGASYEVDMAITLFDGWYDYSGETHMLSSVGHVYLIKVNDDNVFKLTILSYYDETNPGATEGKAVYTIRYQKL